MGKALAKAKSAKAKAKASARGKQGKSCKDSQGLKARAKARHLRSFKTLRALKSLKYEDLMQASENLEARAVAEARTVGAPQDSEEQARLALFARQSWSTRCAEFALPKLRLNKERSKGGGKPAKSQPTAARQQVPPL